MELEKRQDIEIDRNTTLSILRECGEQLRRDLPAPSSLPPQLKHILTELRQRDR